MARKQTFNDDFVIPPGHREIVKYDGNEYLLMTAKCFCRIWQVALGFHIGRCKVCKSHPKVEH